MPLMRQHGVKMEVTIDLIHNTMDLLTTMAVSGIAQDTGLTTSEVLVGFLCSDTGKALYDEETKLWWDGPSAIAENYLRNL